MKQEDLNPLPDTPFTLYKLIVLYALDKSAYPLTNAQISNLFLDNNYTTYFNLQEVLSDMMETSLLETETANGITCYRASSRGEETIRYFSGDIPPAIREEISAYLRSHAKQLRDKTQTTAAYRKTAGHDYLVHCRVMEGDAPLIDLQLTVPTESSAQKLTENWKERSQYIYESVLKQLSS